MENKETRETQLKQLIEKRFKETHKISFENLSINDLFELVPMLELKESNNILYNEIILYKKEIWIKN